MKELLMSIAVTIILMLPFYLKWFKVNKMINEHKRQNQNVHNLAEIIRDHAEILKQIRIQQLKLMLAASIQEEDYEKSAKIRDKIKNLE